MRSALAALLCREPDFEVTHAEWPRLLEPGQESARELQPQVCVADADCPGWRRHVGGWMTPGVNALRARRFALVVLTGSGKPGNLRRAYEARALGFVSKDRSADRLPTAVRQAAQGKRYVDESLAVEFMQAAEAPLTRRELSVLSLSAEGATVAEIARSLHLCNGTVRNYLATITRKTGARNRVDAIRISRVAGWV
jgi:two-component system response regulator DesR